jgi:hypothetical protein
MDSGGVPDRGELAEALLHDRTCLVRADFSHSFRFPPENPCESSA